MPETAPSDRTRVKRYHWLARYDRETIDAIIDAALVAHVGYLIDGAPVVTPTCPWRIGDHVYWHGSAASRMLRAQDAGLPVCLTVTHLDGVAFSRAAFNHNLLYRSVMAFGTTEAVEGEDKRVALKAFIDKLAPGLWDHARPPTDQEWKASKVIRMRLDEVSTKVADARPDEDAEDLATDRWAGHVPLSLQAGAPVPDPKLPGGIAVPDFVAGFRL
ncbi:pyridoxamine 5'-phosphate oxidase family protein [Rhodovulum kholense]|uniref:Nitroimidazol reductase NimA-like FMN-containing flavoprotein (Pyridoxamine 5'-phosphate oxidase superfamily) n=1 Tax=Rhodovulum kholense TaxID=453584 RepID=A0A8E3ANR0_9RHOB|nr:pyridoxamine 5'-phosphate oxidase family protein [Rhodovulum kholense]PTW35434.1 hypothetical protein C8N38_1372 [Rhodovulum kholense]